MDKELIKKYGKAATTVSKDRFIRALTYDYKAGLTSKTSSSDWGDALDHLKRDISDFKHEMFKDIFGVEQVDNLLNKLKSQVKPIEDGLLLAEQIAEEKARVIQSDETVTGKISIQLGCTVNPIDSMDLCYGTYVYKNKEHRFHVNFNRNKVARVSLSSDFMSGRDEITNRLEKYILKEVRTGKAWQKNVLKEIEVLNKYGVSHLAPLDNLYDIDKTFEVK